MTSRTYEPLTEHDFDAAYPQSRKIYVDGPQDVRVPMREIALSRGLGTLQVYDTSGPRGYDHQTGLPANRLAWIRGRGDAVETAPGAKTLRAASGRTVTQLHYARRG